MTINEIKTATRDELVQRANEIKGIAESNETNHDFVALQAELEDINAAIKAFDAQASAKSAVQMTDVMAFGNPVSQNPENLEKSSKFGADSELYKSAWLKKMGTFTDANGITTKLFGDLTAEEQKAFTFTTVNSSSVVPTVIMNRIIELVASEAPMYDDSIKSGMQQGFGIPRHTAIVAGDAAATEEGVANDDEQDAFDLLELTGVEIKKHIEITQKLKWKSIDAFETWIVNHLARRIIVAKENHMRTRLDSTTTGIAAGNKKTALAYTDDNILLLFGLIRGRGVKRIYMNQNTLYNFISKIRNQNGDKVFVPNSNDDPVEGRIYGAGVRINNDIPDHVIYLGYIESLLSNDYVEMLMQTDTDSKTWKQINSAFSLFDAGLENPLAFAKGTFDPEAPTQSVDVTNLDAIVAAKVAEALAAQAAG